jgi:flagellar hook-associated protein 1 FlgK
MASDLLSIAASGARAARLALDVTGQNIANATTEGYVRRSVGISEIAPPSGFRQVSDTSFAGVRVTGVQRHVDQFRLAEARRTATDAGSAEAQYAAMTDIERGLESSGIHDAAVAFESSLEALAADTTSLPLRTATVERARVLASSYGIAASNLSAQGSGLQSQAVGGVQSVNDAAQELARLNIRIARSQGGSSDQAALLDRRDAMLQQLAGQADIAVTYNSNQTVDVALGSGGAVLLVQGDVAASFAHAVAGDGTLSFTLGGSPVTLSGGALAGTAQASVDLRDTLGALDTAAANLIALANTAQANGAALDGSAGQPLFTGTGAADIALAFTDPALLATAPAGSSAGSRDPANLTALRAALATGGPAREADALLHSVSSRTAGLEVTRDVLATIATGARVALADEAGVDLDQEAVNLLRFQQAFQASGRVMQTANDVIETLLRIG